MPQGRHLKQKGIETNAELAVTVAITVTVADFVAVT
jgi:hypothetical protein